MRPGGCVSTLNQTAMKCGFHADFPELPGSPSPFPGEFAGEPEGNASKGTFPPQAEQNRPFQGVLFVLHLCVSGAAWKGLSEPRAAPKFPRAGRCWNPSESCAAAGPKPSM